MGTVTRKKKWTRFASVVVDVVVYVTFCGTPAVTSKPIWTRFASVVGDVALCLTILLEENQCKENEHE